MSKYLSDARHYAKQIRHYHEHGGARGYTASLPYFHEFGNLMKRAGKSRIGKGDVPFIHAIYKDMKILMEEMQIRSD